MAKRGVVKKDIYDELCKLVVIHGVNDVHATWLTLKRERKLRDELAYEKRIYEEKLKNIQKRIK